jgi:hypothetical protein
MSDRTVYSWVRASSPYNSLSLQAQLLAETISRQLCVNISVLHPEIRKPRHALVALAKSGMPLIWHYGGFDPYMIGMKHNSKTLFVYHNITPAHFFWTTQPLVGVRSLLGRLQLLLLPKNFKWIAVSEHNAQELRRFGFTDVVVCPNIVITEDVGEVSKAKHVSLIYNGRITPNKNCTALLEQVAWVAERLGALTELIIVGDVKPGCRFGKSFEHQLAALAGHPWLRIDWKRGGIPTGDLHTLYKRAWLYVSMSLHEGFGLPICEAIAQGTPALYLECGGTESILWAYGMVPLNQSREFGQHVLRLIASPTERQALLGKQQEIARDYMSPRIDGFIKQVYATILE